MLKIKQVISENSSGGQVKQVMDITYKKTAGVKTTKYTFTDCCFISVESHQRFHRRDLLILHNQKKRKMFSKRGTRIILEANPKGIHNSSSTG